MRADPSGSGVRYEPPGLVEVEVEAAEVEADLRLGAPQAARLTDAKNAAIPPAVCRKRRRSMLSESDASVAFSSTARASSASRAPAAAGMNSPFETGPTTTGNRRSSSAGPIGTLWRTAP